MARRSMIGTVTSKGQVTIPKPLRDSLGIRTGERLEFRDGGEGRIIARKAGGGEAVDDAYGILDLAGSTDTIVERMRGKPDAV